MLRNQADCKTSFGVELVDGSEFGGWSHAGTATAGVGRGSRADAGVGRRTRRAGVARAGLGAPTPAARRRSSSRSAPQVLRARGTRNSTAMTKLFAGILALLGTHACAFSLPLDDRHESSTTLAGEWHLREPSVLSATTAVLRAVVMAPAPSRVPATGADASSSAHRFQAAQASATALLADNTLEWLLAQSNVADTVRHLLSGDYSATVEARNYDSTAQRPSAADVTRGHGASHTANWTARAAKVRAPPRQMNATGAHEATGLPARAAALGPAVDSTGSASGTAQNHAVAGVWPRRLDEGNGEAQCPATTAYLQAASEHAQLDFTGGYHNNDHCRWDIQCDQAVAFRLTAIDTEGNFDFVSLYDGGGRDCATACRFERPRDDERWYIHIRGSGRGDAGGLCVRRQQRGRWLRGGVLVRVAREHRLHG